MALGQVAIVLAALNGPEGQTIFVNPEEIVSIRAPRETQAEHFAHGVHCVLQTADGKLVNVADNCDVVRAKVGAKQ
jgi:hypothetical protein